MDFDRVLKTKITEKMDTASENDNTESGDENTDEESVMLPDIFPFLYGDISLIDAIQQLHVESELNAQNNPKVLEDAKWCLYVLNATESFLSKITYKNNNGQTPFELLRPHNLRKAVLRCLELKKKDLQVSDDQEEFLDAVRSNDLTALRRMLDAHREEIIAIDINRRGQLRENFGHTALTLACGLGHIDVVNLLLENGADMTIASLYNAATL